MQLRLGTSLSCIHGFSACSNWEMISGLENGNPTQGKETASDCFRDKGSPIFSPPLVFSKAENKINNCQKQLYIFYRSRGRNSLRICSGSWRKMLTKASFLPIFLPFPSFGGSGEKQRKTDKLSPC